MAKVIVYHSYLGCDTGCCGHTVEVVGTNERGFDFDHPGLNQDHLEFAKKMVRQELGEAHVADLDWDNCLIEDD